MSYARNEIVKFGGCLTLVWAAFIFSGFLLLTCMYFWEFVSGRDRTAWKWGLFGLAGMALIIGGYLISPIRWRNWIALEEKRRQRSATPEEIEAARKALFGERNDNADSS